MKYFGTDGIRGEAETLITDQLAYKVGLSLSLCEPECVVIGRDTRISGERISRSIIKGVLESGLNVLDLGVVPTPLLAYFSILNKCHGVMITASHNPYTDNGIKIFNQGRKTTAQAEAKIEDVIDGIKTIDITHPGTLLDSIDVFPEYMHLFKDILSKSNLKLGFDLANGATVKTGNYIFDQILENPIYIGNTPNGVNINKGVGSTHIDHLANIVVKNNLDAGFSFDGDGDRVLAIDEDGHLIDGDLLIYITAKYLKQHNQLNNDIVVLTKMSNIGIIKALNTLGIQVVQTDVGDKYVVQAMHDLDGCLGGENSGHIINRNLFISGDGVLNAVLLIKIMTESNKTFKELTQEITMYPDKLVNLKNIDKTIANDPSLIDLVNQIKTELGSEGKVLVRPSGTENLIRVSASAKTMEQVDHIINTIIDKIKSIQESR